MEQKVTGFTLLELLVVISLIAILSAITVSVVAKVSDSASKTKEISAAKNLVAAYHAAAAENDGRYLPGYDRTVGEVKLPDGRVIAGPAANRYPFRLAAYMSYQIEDIILVGENAEQIDRSDDYQVSLNPAFGINRYFVGGDVQSDGTVINREECITSTAFGATKTIVFASAGMVASSGDIIHGFNILTPPNLHSRVWSTAEWNDATDPDDYGNLDVRYGNKAIIAYLDGSVRMNTVDELRDMRLWSHRAAAQDDADYMIERTSSGGRLR